MTIKKALKLKNKLIKNIGENTQLMQRYNSVEVGNERPYSSQMLYKQIETDTKELALLKSRIHIANVPVMKDIFWMSEMKSIITNLKKMECVEGKSNLDRYRMGSELVMTSEISLVSRNQEIKMLEGKIEEIQDKAECIRRPIKSMFK